MPGNFGDIRAEPPSPEELQAMMPGYTIERLLGRGAMGAVYQGRQGDLDRPVAIKVISIRMEADGANFAARFKNEARAMAKLSHPGIVAVYDSGETESGLLYIAMEFVEGTDVGRMIAENGRLHTDHALAIAAHVCDALAYAHERGIIHRDIKPANIMVGYDGVVKVADFGLAKIDSGGETAGLTQGGMAMGTLHYMAPEALTLGAAADHRADIYAVGVMLYQMLTGKLPHGMFELPSLQVPGLDPRYDAIITKAMREDRNIRYQSASELRSDLDSILTQPVVQVEPGAQQAPAALPTEVRPKRPDGQPFRPPQPKIAAQRPVKRGSPMPWLVVIVILGLAAWFYLGRSKLELPVEAVADSSASVSIQKANQAAPVKAPTAATNVVGKTPAPESAPVSTTKAPAPTATVPVTRSPLPAAPSVPELAALDQQFQKLQAERVMSVFDADVAKLNAGYLGGLDREIAKERAAGRLDGVLALEAEKKHVADARPVPGSDDANTIAAVKNLRTIYRDALAKIETTRTANIKALTDPLTLRLKTLEADLTKQNRIAHAKAVREYRDKLTVGDSIASDGSFTNSLGMKFVPVPGTDILMCIHETRRKDYAAYANSNLGVNDEWKSPKAFGKSMVVGENHPVENTSWEDARAFCSWLSKKEGKTYRLPTDREWSCAVGIGDQETMGASPENLDGKVLNVYPWGTVWPPPRGAGNYWDTTTVAMARPKKSDEFSGAEGYLDGFGYTDGFATASPVMSFPPNSLGIYDLGGNEYEVCEDEFGPSTKDVVFRGASWAFNGRRNMLSSARVHQPRNMRIGGFRCVVISSSIGGGNIAAAKSSTPSPTTAATAPPAATAPLVAAATTTTPQAGFTNTLGMAFENQRFENSLGMKFVSLPGTKALMCIHETRMSDYTAFTAATPGVNASWRSVRSDDGAPVSVAGDHPVLNITWAEAVAFCTWLSNKESRTYRLPSDREWSIAVGIASREMATATPKALHNKLRNEYPWGTQWPPPPGAGNFGDTATAAISPKLKPIKGYNDGNATTAPVMSFPPNRLGIYDLAGNAWEYVSDFFDDTKQAHVLRGGGWAWSDREWLNSSARDAFPATGRMNIVGFRCVVELPATPAPNPPQPPATTPPSK